MNVEIIWKAILMVGVGFLLLRMVGRKSVSQMSIATTVVMISIGAIIVQPVADKGIINTIIASAFFIIFLILLEYLTMKSNLLEKLITGKSKVVIENGQLELNNMKKLRLTVDMLELQLRQKGIKQISDIKTATIEPNGQLGYELIPDKEPLTVGEFKKLMSQMGFSIPQEITMNPTTTNLFEEINQKNEPPNPEQLH